jgi:hypothetical protein
LATVALQIPTRKAKTMPLNGLTEAKTARQEQNDKNPRLTEQQEQGD